MVAVERAKFFIGFGGDDLGVKASGLFVRFGCCEPLTTVATIAASLASL